MINLLGGDILKPLFSSCLSAVSLVADKNSILQMRKEHGVLYQRCVPGCQLMDWLLQDGEAEGGLQGVELCGALQEHGIIQHGGELLICSLIYDRQRLPAACGGRGGIWDFCNQKQIHAITLGKQFHLSLNPVPLGFALLYFPPLVAKKHDFFDGGLLHQFCINFCRRWRLSELLNGKEQDNNENAAASTPEDSNLDSPFIPSKDTLQEPIVPLSLVIIKLTPLSAFCCECKLTRNDSFTNLSPVGSSNVQSLLSGGHRASLNGLQHHVGGFPPLAQLSSDVKMRSNPKSGKWKLKIIYSI